MDRWYDKAVEELEKSDANGEISPAEFRQQMRELNDELRAQTEEHE